MTKLVWLLGAIVLALATNTGCDWVASLLDNAEKRLASTKPDSEYRERTTPIEADFVVTGNNLYYKGQQLPLLEDVQNLIRVLGANYKKLDDRVYAWDDLGTYCHTSHVSGKVTEIGLIMRSDPQSTAWTKRLYEKDILVDGAVINRDTPIGQFNRNKRGERFQKRALSYYEYSDETTVAGIKTNVTFSIHVDFNRRVDKFSVDVTCHDC